MLAKHDRMNDFEWIRSTSSIFLVIDLAESARLTEILLKLCSASLLFLDDRMLLSFELLKNISF